MRSLGELKCSIYRASSVRLGFKKEICTLCTLSDHVNKIRFVIKTKYLANFESISREDGTRLSPCGACELKTSRCNAQLNIVNQNLVPENTGIIPGITIKFPGDIRPLIQDFF